MSTDNTPDPLAPLLLDAIEDIEMNRPVRVGIRFRITAVLRSALGTARQHAEGEAHDYTLVCKVCGQPGAIRVSIDPNFPDPEEPNQWGN